MNTPPRRPNRQVPDAPRRPPRRPQQMPMIQPRNLNQELMDIAKMNIVANYAVLEKILPPDLVVKTLESHYTDEELRYSLPQYYNQGGNGHKFKMSSKYRNMKGRGCGSSRVADIFADPNYTYSVYKEEIEGANKGAKERNDANKDLINAGMSTRKSIKPLMSEEDFDARKRLAGCPVSEEEQSGSGKGKIPFKGAKSDTYYYGNLFSGMATNEKIVSNYRWAK